MISDGTDAAGPIEVSARIRIERGPARKRAVANAALLADSATARHYYAGTRKERDPFTGKPADKIGRDAKGRRIAHGKVMKYLDWLGPPVWYVYTLGEDGGGPRWVPVAVRRTKEAALAVAQRHAADAAPPRELAFEDLIDIPDGDA
jgi:hypothetical protein